MARTSLGRRVASFALALAWTAVTHGSSAAQAPYRYSLHDYPGAGSTLFLGENFSGEIVGFAWGFASPPTISFSYRQHGDLFTPIATLPGYGEFDVWNVNDRGTMVGGVYTTDYSSETAFTRDHDGNIALLPVPGWPNSEAQAINRQGIVAGLAYNADATQYTGFMYDPAHQKFTFVMPSAYTLVHAVTSQGELVGLSILDAGVAYANAPAGTYGWYRAVNGAITLFRVNGIDTYARALNDDGLLGGFIEDPVTGIDTGFSTSFTPSPAKPGSRHFVALSLGQKKLVSISGQADTYVEAITSEGDLVGATIDNDGNIHGFIGKQE